MSDFTETFPARADDARIPDSLRELVDAELNDGETIQWMDQPVPVFFSSDSGVLQLFIMSFVISFVISVLFAFLTGAFGLDMQTLLGFIGTALLFAVSITFSMWNAMRKQVKQVVFVITNYRAMVVNKTAFVLNVTSYYPTEFSCLSRKQRASRAGHLYFGAGHSNKNHNLVSGFFNIRNVQEVERLIQELKGTK